MFPKRFFVSSLFVLFFCSVPVAHALTSDDLTTMYAAGTALKHSTANFDIYYTDDCTNFPQDCIATNKITAFGTVLEEIRTEEYRHGFDFPVCGFHVFVMDIPYYGVSKGQSRRARMAPRVANQPLQAVSSRKNHLILRILARRR